MRKRLSIFLMAAVMGVTTLGCPVSVLARYATIQNGVGADNISVETIYSDGLDIGSLDMYRIFYYLLDEDSRLGHIDVDAADTKLSGRVAPGDYQIARIQYIGSSKELKKQPVATKTFFRVYNDQVTTIPIAIGEDAVNKLTDKIGIGSLYKELDVNSTVENTLNENEVSMSSPYMDDSVFGDEDVREEYLKNLTDSGYLDEDGALTDSGKKIQEALKEKGLKYEAARQDAIVKGVSLEEYLGINDGENSTNKYSKNGSSYKNTQEEASSGDAEETRFDQDDQEQKTEKKSAKDRFISSLISICILGVIVFGVIIYIKRKY